MSKRLSSEADTEVGPVSPTKKSRKSHESPVKGKKKGGLLAALDGWWRVDIGASDTPETYLRFMGLVNDNTVSAGNKAHTEFGTYCNISIKQAGRSIVMERHSRLINGRVDKFKLGETQTTTLKKLGEKTMTVTGGPKGEIITVSSVPTLVGVIEVHDTRVISDDDVNIMLQTVKCSNRKTGETMVRTLQHNRAQKPQLPLQPLS